MVRAFRIKLPWVFLPVDRLVIRGLSWNISCVGIFSLQKFSGKVSCALLSLICILLVWVQFKRRSKLGIGQCERWPSMSNDPLVSLDYASKSAFGMEARNSGASILLDFIELFQVAIYFVLSNVRMFLLLTEFTMLTTTIGGFAHRTRSLKHALKFGRVH